MIESLLDTDLYKLTMMQFAWRRHREVEVKYEFTNRHVADVALFDFVSPYDVRIAEGNIRGLTFTQGELAYLRSLGLFKDDFLDALRDDFFLPPLYIGSRGLAGQLELSTVGPWWCAMMWETFILSTVNELYNKERCGESGETKWDAYAEGMVRLSKKLDKLAGHPDIQIVDFGTRRRYSQEWHGFVLSYLQRRCVNLRGTSNVWLAQHLDMQPIGTYAHEVGMVYGGIYTHNYEQDYSLSHREFLRNWQFEYSTSLSIALTDTFGSEFFFTQTPQHIAESWHGLRHDSGNPFDFVNRAILWYHDFGIDPKTKTIVFSDGLDVDTILALSAYCEGRVQCVFGWGTDLMNDLGNQPLSIVMKATQAIDKGYSVSGRAVPLVKLSDNLAKASGPKGEVQRVYNLLNSGFLEEKDA